MPEGQPNQHASNASVGNSAEASGGCDGKQPDMKFGWPDDASDNSLGVPMEADNLRSRDTIPDVATSVSSRIASATASAASLQLPSELMPKSSMKTVMAALRPKRPTAPG